MSISAIGSLPIRLPANSPAIAGNTPGNFDKVFGDALRKVEQSRQDANTAVNSFLRGENEDVHTAAVAVQKAEMNFELFLQVRNKVAQAYQEVMRMQI